MVRAQQLDIHWRPCRNDAGEQIPPFPVLRSLGQVEPGAWTLKVGKPDEDSGKNVLFGGPTRVEPNDPGLYTRTFPAQARFEVADGTPAVGDTVGPKAGSWRLSILQTGFVVVAVDGEEIWVIPSPGGGSGDRVVHANGLPPESDGGIDFFPGNFDELQQQGGGWAWIVPPGDLYIVNANPTFV